MSPANVRCVLAYISSLPCMCACVRACLFTCVRVPTGTHVSDVCNYVRVCVLLYIIVYSGSSSARLCVGLSVRSSVHWSICLSLHSSVVESDFKQSQKVIL